MSRVVSAACGTRRWARKRAHIITQRQTKEADSEFGGFEREWKLEELSTASFSLVEHLALCDSIVVIAIGGDLHVGGAMAL